MKTYIKFLLFSGLLIAGLALIHSCDKIEEPFVLQIGSSDTAACPVPDFPVVTQVKKRVLLEDYTGHRCVNCPKAAQIGQNLKEQYGEQLVMLAVHAGFFANPAGGKFTYDFRSEAGTAWDNFFGIGMVGNPNGMVNRKGLPNNHVIDPTGWGTQISSALNSAPVIDLQMINEYDPAERKLCTHIKTNFITTLDKNLKLTVVLTESGIVKPQSNHDEDAGETPVIEEYVHNHVMRGAISTTWGATIATMGTANTESVVKSYKYILKDEYVPENCTVIAFIYDDDTKEVLQAVEADVM